jgi:hypothetical protein
MTDDMTEALNRDHIQGPGPVDVQLPKDCSGKVRRCRRGGLRYALAL